MPNQLTASIWRNRIFMKMFGSYSISMFGRWFDMVAIMILFGYVWRAEPLMIALIPIMYALPHALFSQFFGILADRINKIKLMITADIMTAAMTVALIFATKPAIALIILFFRATITAVHFPAQQSMIKHVVHEKLIVKAVTLNGTVNEFSKIIGPLIGGSLAGIYSPKLCIAINACAFTISAIILLTIKNKEAGVAPTDADTSNDAFWKTWKAGWSSVLSNRVLYVCISFALVGFIAIQMVDVQFPVLFREIAPRRPELVGWVMASVGAGAIVVMFTMNRISKLQSYGVILGASFVLVGVGFGGVGMLSFGFSSYYVIVLGFVAGLGAGMLTIGISYILQSESTKETIGRVSGIYQTLSSLALLIAPLIGGVFVSLYPVKNVFVGVGATVILIGLFGVVFKRLFVGTDSQKREESIDQTVNS